jgi:glutaredoxin
MSILKAVENSHLLVISKKICRNCVKLKELLDNISVSYDSIVLETYMEMYDDDDFIFEEIEHLKKNHKIDSYPMVFIRSEYIPSGYTEFSRMNEVGILVDYLKEKGITFNRENQSSDDDF